jgi:hypothetical protein
MTNRERAGKIWRDAHRAAAGECGELNCLECKHALDLIERALDEAASQEREACAAMVEAQRIHSDFHFGMKDAEKMMATKIRARGRR